MSIKADGAEDRDVCLYPMNNYPEMMKFVVFLGTQGGLTALTIQVLVEHGLLKDRLGGGHLDMTAEMVGGAVPPADHGLGRDAGHLPSDGLVA